MLAFKGMLVPSAEAAGIKLPDDLENYDKEQYPHWAVYCSTQLGSPMPYPAAHWDNANTIASIPDNKIKTITFEELEKLGLQIGFSKVW
jgi:hypothetical protein